MQIWQGLQPISAEFQGGTLLIGNFDGLHVGHQSLIKKAVEEGHPVVVMTFDPHPVQILYPERHLQRLLPREDVAEQLPRFGVDLLVILNFTKELSSTAAKDFWSQYLAQPFQPKNVVAGHDFAFGKSREGSLVELKRWCEASGCRLHVMPPLQMEGEIVSSRGIRELVKAGEVDKILHKLGRPFYLRGQVGQGAGRGKQLGSPTLNLQEINETMPPHGVYATLTRFKGERWLSVTNIGINPTFQSNSEMQETKIETHLIDRDFEGRGEWVDVDFIERLRPEMKFPSIEDLKAQIQNDILKAKAVVERYEKMDGTQHRK